MAILTDIFVAEREINHEEHERLTAEIEAFEAVLKALPANGHNRDEFRRLERRIADAVPRHFATEEKTVLASLGREHPETKPFCKAMKRQHAAIQKNWEKFQSMTAGLAFSAEPSKAAEIRQHGLYFTRQLLQHMNAEDKRIAEILG